MTEKEFLTSTDPAAMLAWLTGADDTPWLDATRWFPQPSNRKLWLFITAVERLWARNEVDMRDSLQRVEALAEGRIDPRGREAGKIAFSYHFPTDNAAEAARMCLYVHNTRSDLLKWAALLRCLVGNPWRPVTLQAYEPTPSFVERGVLGEMRVCPTTAGSFVESPWLAWDGGTIPRMARQIYADRDWAALPVLGDALESAGCTCREILHHLRGPGPHARGCFAVDCLLGKS